MSDFKKDFENNLNALLVDTFNNILKYEELCLKSIYNVSVTVSEAHIIDSIGKAGKPSVSELAGLLGITPPTATVAVQKLERKGFLTKARDETDARKSFLCLTETGARVNKAHSLFHRRLVRNISGQFDDREKEILLTAMRKISQYFKNKVGLDEP